MALDAALPRGLSQIVHQKFQSWATARILKVFASRAIVGPTQKGVDALPEEVFASLEDAIGTTLLTNFIAAGIYPPTQCALAPAVGQVCTPPGSLFNLVNNPPAAPAGPQATATWVLTGVTNDGQSTWVGNFTSQFGVPYQTLLGQLASTGSVTNSYSATFTVTQNPVVPEPTTLLLMSSGLLAFGFWKRRSRS